MGSGGDGNQALLFTLGVVALSSVKGMSSYVMLERRHPDGEHWVEFARFASKADAELARTRLVEAGHGDASELRVHRVDLQQH